MSWVHLRNLSLAKLLRALVDAPHSYEELVAETGLHTNTIRDTMNAMRSEGLVYVAGWDVDLRGTASVPVWHWGPGKRDARRPKKTSTERSREYRARKKQTALAGVFTGVQT